MSTAPAHDVEPTVSAITIRVGEIVEPAEPFTWHGRIYSFGKEMDFLVPKLVLALQGRMVVAQVRAHKIKKDGTPYEYPVGQYPHRTDAALDSLPEWVQDRAARLQQKADAYWAAIDAVTEQFAQLDSMREASRD